MVWKVGKNSTEWLNKLASPSSLSHWLAWTLATDSGAWLVGSCPPLERWDHQENSVQLLLSPAQVPHSLYTQFQKFPIQTHQCPLVDVTQSETPAAFCVGFRWSLFWAVVALLASTLSVHVGFAVSYLGGGEFVILCPQVSLRLLSLIWIPLGLELWEGKLVSERKTRPFDLRVLLSCSDTQRLPFAFDFQFPHMWQEENVAQIQLDKWQERGTRWD